MILGLKSDLGELEVLAELQSKVKQVRLAVEVGEQSSQQDIKQI